MRTGITVTVTAEDRLRLEAIIDDGNARGSTFGGQDHPWDGGRALPATTMPGGMFGRFHGNARLC